MRGKTRDKAVTLPRQILALDLRKSGHTYRDIADRLGVSHQTAYKDVHSELARLAQMRDNSAGEVLQLELERIDKAIYGLMHFVEAGSAPHIMALLRCIEQRAKLLGLYAPEKFSIEWQDKAVASIKAGEVAYEPLADEFGSDLATQLFAMAGIAVSQTGSSEA